MTGQLRSALKRALCRVAIGVFAGSLEGEVFYDPRNIFKPTRQVDVSLGLNQGELSSSVPFRGRAALGAETRSAFLAGVHLAISYQRLLYQRSRWRGVMGTRLVATRYEWPHGPEGSRPYYGVTLPGLVLGIDGDLSGTWQLRGEVSWAVERVEHLWLGHLDGWRRYHVHLTHRPEALVTLSRSVGGRTMGLALGTSVSRAVVPAPRESEGVTGPEVRLSVRQSFVRVRYALAVF